jgi:hypothetical protein
VKATFSLYPDPVALADLEQPVRPVYSYNPLVQIGVPSAENASAVEETHA